ncbi:CAP domain-containing protein [Streptomyces sp. NPDC059999]|uniref:CAP domain-containing protein n=1 Tax=Streptomyces sp. NPDC059999 TaxID=3347030 RepID=UPI0036CB9BD3
MGRHKLPAPPRRGGGKRGTAVRIGIVGVPVALVLGTTAVVTTGIVPVGGSFPYVGTDTGAKTEAKASPSARDENAVQGQGGLAGLRGRASTPAAPGSATPTRPSSPSPSASPSPTPTPTTQSPTPKPQSPTPAASTKAPEPKPVKPEPVKPQPVKPEPVKPQPVKPEPVKPEPEKPTAPAPKPEPKPDPEPEPTRTPSAPAPKPTAPAPSGGHSAEEAAVLTLVNQARAQAGCGPVRANPPLAALAGAFSKDMAVRGFFDHTDPDGNTPWKRADNAGISGLAGENIARGQGDADAVMKAWMNSPGHKANILNCEFRTLGVGAYFAAGGPWWTQDFGF